MSLGLANTPLINYFFYKQSTMVSSVVNNTSFPILSVADGGNGQLVITTDDTSLLTVGVAVTIESTASYNGNFTVISLTPTTFNISGEFGVTETGTWKLASNITGASVGDPLDFGEVFFFDNVDKITPLDTFSDRDLTIPNTNPIVLDAVGSVPPIYLLDQPYFIKIIDKFNNLVATLDNYLPRPTSGSGAGEVPLGNLISNYGFDTRINDNIFSVTSVPANSTNAVSAGWFWEIATTETNPENTYEFIELGNSNIIGNPKNEIVLKSTNNTAGQTVNTFYTVLGDYNKFQGSTLLPPLQLKLSIFTRLQSGAPSNIPVSLVRLKNGVPQTPIGVGFIEIATLRNQETLLFTVPDLTTADFDNDDELRLVLSLPINTDFQFAFTGSWLQISPNDTLSITEDAGAQDAAKEFFGKSFRQLQASPQFPNRGLPIAIGLGGAEILNTTGTIFQAATQDVDQYNYAVSMGTFLTDTESVELIRDKTIKSTQTNRLIDFLRANNFTQSRLTFIASNLLAKVSVGLGIGAAENSTWNDAGAPSITVTKLMPNELIHKVSVVGLGNGNTRWTFVDNFAPIQLPFNPVYAGAGGAAGNTLYQGGDPDNHPIISWVGDAAFFQSNNFKNQFFSNLEQTTVNPGSGSEQAVVDIRFVDNTAMSQLTGNSVNAAALPVNVVTYFYKRRPIYHAAQTGRNYVDGGGSADVTPIPNINYLAYNDISLNPSPQVDPPPHSIRFTIAGVTSFAPAGTISTANVPLDGDDQAAQVSANVIATVNTSFTYEIDIGSTPANGEVVEISNATTDFNLIYHDLAQTKPVNTGVREAIFVEFNSIDIPTQVAAATVAALENGVMGVPRAADIGLEFRGDSTFTNAPTYFMVL